MKKKVFSLLAVVFFMVSSLNAWSLSEENNACAEIAFELQGDLEEQGVPKEIANEVASLVYDICANA